LHREEKGLLPEGRSLLKKKSLFSLQGEGGVVITRKQAKKGGRKVFPLRKGRAITFPMRGKRGETFSFSGEGKGYLFVETQGGFFVTEGGEFL